jgi:ferredoxin
MPIDCINLEVNARMKIKVRWSLCDGNGACASEAPEFFSLDENDQLHVPKKDFGESAADQVRAAVRACPKHALSIDEK